MSMADRLTQLQEAVNQVRRRKRDAQVCYSQYIYICKFFFINLQLGDYLCNSVGVLQQTETENTQPAGGQSN